MHIRLTRLLPLALLTLAPALIAQSPAASDQTRYLLPPKKIVDAFDVAAAAAGSMLSPNKQVMALTYHTAQPDIAELAQPVLRLAGARVNPKTYGPQRTSLIYAITLKRHRRRRRGEGRRAAAGEPVEREILA